MRDILGAKMWNKNLKINGGELTKTLKVDENKKHVRISDVCSVSSLGAGPDSCWQPGSRASLAALSEI